MAVSSRSVPQGTSAANKTTVAPSPTCSQGTAARIAFNTPNRSRPGSTVVAPRRRGCSGGTARLRISNVSSIRRLRHGIFQYPDHQFFETDACRSGGHGYQTVIGHSRHRVYFKQPEFAIRVLHDVYPAPGTAADHSKSIQRQVLQT